MQAMENNTRFLILYASQTGNALDAAERVWREAEHRGCPAAVVLSMDDFPWYKFFIFTTLPNEEAVVFVVSTTGQGDIPDSMKIFWRFLLQKNLSQNWLKGVRYAVFGLGDSGYQKINFAAKKVDKRLSDLGGTPIIERSLGDDQHPLGYEGALDPWLSSLWRILNQMSPRVFVRGIADVDSATEILVHPKFQVIYHEADNLLPNSSSASGSHLIQSYLMIKNHLLTRVGCGKDVCHVEFEALSPGMRYQVGDALEVLPSQDPSAVEAFIQRCNLNPDSHITVLPKCVEIESPGFPSNALRGPVKLRSFVELTMDIASASPRPRRAHLQVMRFFATAEHEKERLQYFASPEGRNDLYQYNQKERRTVLEVLEDFPSVQLPFEWLVQLVPPLKTRAFSISSSPLAHPKQVHLTVSVVSWKTPYKRNRSGLCSTWLAGLGPEEIPYGLAEALFLLLHQHFPSYLLDPELDVPLFAFVAERESQSTSEATAPILFFFGCRNDENDFLYRDFWLSHAQSGGVLSEEKGGGFFVAFSRDQPKKLYVQHKMEEESQWILSLLSSGTAVYIAGSSTKMPTDVMSCIERIVAKEGVVPKDSAVRWLRALEKAGKYHVEAWS
ncbi:hypothetical protein IFM89_010352 [Coptis chinensis]|uniref:NADPH-dependent diflavin oxidoreductase 1 n=1 Tax=Coptis chinensis TaxID=261450 RepID=A0A835LZ67_9MAGN|nr:hypothetical protein IFM89_010352 [Coptis chinensis]